MATLSEAMDSAENESDLFEYVRQVKQAVIRSVEEMNPSVHIQDTGHFNHSAAPDLVLSWPGRRAERPMYLRRSYDELAAGQDVERLAQLSPVFLSLGQGQPGDSSDTAQRLGVTGPRSRDVLVTNAATVDMFTERSTRGSSPLAGAVAAEVLPSGHGLLDEVKAAPVLDGRADVLAELSDVLNPEALSSVSMVAAIVSAARGGDVPSVEGEIRPFTMQEARDLLPWLLKSDDITDTALFWKFVADRVTLKHIEGLSEELADVELSAVCNWGWTSWQAQRASLGLAIRSDDGDLQNADGGWFIRGRLLTYEAGNDAFRFTTYGQAMKDRGTYSSATWPAIRNRIEGARLVQIALRGLERAIRIDAAESGDVREDTEAVLASVEDQYYIDELALRYGSADENRTVRLVLGDQIAHNLGSATIKDMLTALARVAAYRNPVDIAGLPTGEVI